MWRGRPPPRNVDPALSAWPKWRTGESAVTDPLSLILQRQRRQILSFHFPPPPVSGGALFCRSGKAIVIDDGADIARPRTGERILGEQAQNVGRALQQFHHQLNRPGIAAIVPKRGKPHLPVKTRLMRRHPGGAPRQVARLVRSE